MARAKAPDPLRRRHLLEGAPEPAKALAVAEAYLAEDRALDAVPFLARAGATEPLEALRTEAVAAGDVFAVREISAALGRPVDGETWRAVAAGAAAAGKDHYATEATRLATAKEG